MPDTNTDGAPAVATKLMYLQLAAALTDAGRTLTALIATDWGQTATLTDAYMAGGCVHGITGDGARVSVAVADLDRFELIAVS